MPDHSIPDHSLPATIAHVRAVAEKVRMERARRNPTMHVSEEINWYTAADAVLFDGYTTDELATIIAEGIHRMPGNVFEREKAALGQIARRIVRVLAAPELFGETVEMRSITRVGVEHLPLVDSTQEIPAQ